MKDEDVIFREVEWHANKSFHVYVHPKNRIEVHTRNGAGDMIDVKVFHQGDVAEYNSASPWEYAGQIVSITAKSVIIKATNGGTKRLDFRHFAWRNHDFDAARISHENFETSHYI